MPIVSVIPARHGRTIPPASLASLTHLLGIGGVTDSGFVYRARADRAATIAIEYSTNSDLSGSTTSSGVSVVSDDDFTGGESITGLSANTTYYYCIRIDGTRVESAPFSSFTTFPTEGEDADVKVVVVSCQKRATDAVTGCWIPAAAEAPMLQVHLGDFVYGDYKTLDTQRAGYQAEYTGDQQTYVTRVMPRAQTWDDHDFGDNNGDGDLSSKALSKQAWREYVPSYPLANADNGIWYSFKVANCEFFMLDTRYQREGSKPRYPTAQVGTVAAQAGSTGSTLVVPSDAPSMRTWYGRVTVAATGQSHVRRITAFDTGTKTATLDSAIPGLAPGDLCVFQRASMLDMDAIENGQVDWLINGINNSTARWKFFCTSVIWNGTVTGGTINDIWCGWNVLQLERDYLLEHITADNVIVLSGDRHFSGIDDGTNSDWPEMTSSAFHRVTLDPVCVWSNGTYTVTPSYGTVEVDGTNHTVTLRVKDNQGDDAAGVTPLVLDYAA